MPDDKRVRRSDRRGLGPTLKRLARIRLDDWRDVVERVIALVLLVGVALIAGLTLGHNTDQLENLPGLLLMVPAAIALRGNIFGALGSRLGTAIHTGTFRLTLRASSVVGENVIASLILTIATSVALAGLAKGAAIVFGVAGSIGVAEFITVSLVGGLVASLAVMVTALALTAGSVRYGWDPDNVTAPLVTATGDVATVPALVLAAALVDDRAIVVMVTIIGLASLPLAMAWLMRAARQGIAIIVRESMPVLLIGIVLDLVAGVTIERQLDAFAGFPVLLVMLPAFLAVAGALGGTMSSRLSSQLHLGMIAARGVPETRARGEMALSLGLAVPVFAGCAALAHALARASDLASPGIGLVVAAALGGGMVATLLAAIVAYYSTIGSVRAGLDPDTYGIPLVTSTIDLLGAFTLILAIDLLAIA